MRFLRPLFMLIWKNWILHKRHFIITGFEILPPILVSILMVYLASVMRKYGNVSGGIRKYNETTYRPRDPAADLFKSDFRYSQYDTLFFAPATPTMRSLMNRTFSDTILNPVGFDSEHAVIEEAKKTKKKLWGAIIFSEASEDSVPSVLKYKLRPNGDFIDNIGQSYFNGDLSFRVYDYQSFGRSCLLGIQTLIDLNYIKLRQQQNQTEGANIKVYLQRMPYPPYEKIMSVFTPMSLVPMMIISAFFIPCIIIVKRVVAEKANRAKEMMKMMGMSTPAYWSGVFISNYLVLLFIATVAAILFVIPFSSGISVLNETSFSLFFVILLLYSISSLLFSFVITTLFTKASIAITVLVVLWVTSNVLCSVFFQELKVAYLGKVFSCLVPNMAFTLAGIVMSFNEMSGQSAQWSNISEPPFGSRDSFCLATVLGMMLVSCLLYTLLLLYLDAVWPWQPGVPKSPLFCFYPSFWSRSNKTNSNEDDNSRMDDEKSGSFEKEPSHSLPSVIIAHISKVFKVGNVDKIAVNNLSLNLYPGQITALLGHNGAGKTTTMNILTGIFPPTEGSVSINGHDIVTDTNAARSNLGLCPQHNVLYDTLTVEEHLMFFAGLKGMSWPAMKGEITNMIEHLQLVDKRHIQAKELSGGMKRKLSLGNAIIGGSQILILDEPTTGLDPEGRRVIWDLLERLRPQRTILLTTHYMEEADTLGDRIAIMASGTVQCCGSAMFLKKKFGAGYHLRIEKGNNCKVNDIASLVKSYVPEAKLLNDVSLELMFSLSNKPENFSALFQELEKNYDTLGIASCGITITTMDDVFLKVGQMTEEQYQNKDEQNLTNNDCGTMSMHNARKSKPTLFQQMKALLMKRVYYARRHLSILIFQIVLPIVGIILYLYLNFVPVEKSRDSMNLDLDGLFKEKKVGFYYSRNISSENVSLVNCYEKTLDEQNEKVEIIEKNTDINTYLIEKGKGDIDSYAREYLVGGSMQDSYGTLNLTAWYNGIQYNLDPISLNLMTTSLLRYATKNMSENIHVTIQPITKGTVNHYSQDAADIGKMFNAVFIALGLTFLSSSFVLLPIHERVTKVKLLQRMCGVNATVYWFTHLLWDYLVHICSCLLLLIPFIVYHAINGFLATDAVGAIFFCLLLFGLSSTVFAYLVSFIPKVPSTGFSVLTSVNALSGIVITITMTTLALLIPPSNKVKIAMWFMRLFPNFTITWAINIIHINSRMNIRCLSYSKDELLETCNTTVYTGNPCCTEQVREGKGFAALPYLSWDTGAGKECFFLFLTFILWCGILILAETVLPKICFNIVQKIRQINRKGGTILTWPFRWEDSDVSAERQRTEDICNWNAMEREALVVRSLTKTFGALYAVKNLTFSVHKEECFGLLGINGAGKTTTFRMLVGDALPTTGDAYIDRFSIQHSLQEFQMSVGYCPQYDALIDRLTAREMLELFANLRGIPENVLKYNVGGMISMCDLDDYADQQIRSYSGGTKRKLSLAIALIGAPPVILLDEPTAGVDPTARRKIWSTLSSMKQMLGVSFILTSHSMDECESLCNRIAIMVNGEFRCLGAMQSLKTKFGQGYSLVIKLKQEDFSDTSKVATIRTHIERQFPSASLKVEYQGNLHYHITDTTLKWSTMFAVMEEAKRTFQLEDYVLSGTTLEQIFLAFARVQTGL